MENKKKTNQPKDDGWLDTFMPQPDLGEELGPDEQAVASAGLTRPEDAEVDRIISETNSSADTDVLAMEATQHIPLADKDYWRAVESIEEKTQPADGSDAAISEDATVVLPAMQEISAEKASKSEELDIVEHDLFPVEETPVKEKVSKKEPPVRKGRPKMKKGYGLFGLPHVIATVIWLVIALSIGVSLGRMLWVCAADVLAFGRESKEYTVTITDSDNIDTIASKLKNVGLIRYPELFKLYAELTGAEEEIAPGTFTLNSLFDYHALVNSMTPHAPGREEVEVLIPEGYTCAQIFALLEEKGVCSVAELETFCAEGEVHDYWFLEGVELNDRYSLEGYLFPDTYRFYLNDDPDNVIAKMLSNFDYRFTDLMKEKIDPLNERMAKVLASRGYGQDYIDEHKFTIREIVIIASMIERETANDAESFDISSVIYNRLTNAKSYPYLNIDATIIYALGGNIDPETGNTKPLTKADLEMDHPYNTYNRKGLIPGPISNPGRASLLAALDPNETSYYFYVYNPNTSTHLFAKTREDHEKNVNYVRSLGG